MATQVGKRTNSLAFARTDCHTCASRGQKCDRQRPQCATCISHGRKCGGFATPLSWDHRRTRNRALASQDDSGEDAAVTTPKIGNGQIGKDPPRHFKFVLGGKRDRKRRKVVQPRNNTRAEKEAKEVNPPQPVDIADIDASPPGDDETSFDLVALAQSEHLFDPTNWLGDAFQDGLSFISSDMGPVEGLVSTLRAPTLESVSGAGSGPSQPLGNQHEALLQMYDTEFCVLPITSDTALNPFRCREPLSQGSRLLFHSILALCCRHLSQITGTPSSEEREHRNQAFKLLENALQSDQLARRGLTLLDPLLVLFTLDCTLSASGRWSTYLTRAHSILEACGGPPALDNARIRSQVAMILWWDATLALVSRQGTVFSQSYLDHLIHSEKKDRWSFYDLTGCPSDLVVIIFKLAELAHQSTIASTMKWLTFNLTPIVQIEEQLRSWTHSFFAAPSYNQVSPSVDEGTGTPPLDEHTFHAHQDRHHCAEAWRHALLLYIERIFRWDRNRIRPLSIPCLARLTLNHVRCCRRTSQTQKQLLLPVFLAGSETGDEEMRDLARGYCRWWGERSRYNMFHSVPVLLEDIWGGDKWWGGVVDEKTKGASTAEGSNVQFLFG
ncbi:fungal-specific transcription factor domain-containing protein [Aspergillus caelatus]|uniref:Fungal-specific transcription factor domain-containing protein n=1 Tax=Aspergillus caelatus TaxID=61420 RepID=A0A5N7A928_9EURO|nr:fungal-specific transcription factor domain-containing protein [Aspergillus caelatus]KAE8366377.1 fungal-specific transcription factor domain-containing protein [Aspergillus caelatus]